MTRNFKRIPLLAIPLAALVALSITGTAAARQGGNAPPGNSAINQYLETIPTASGGRPTHRFHGHGGSNAGGANRRGRGGGTGARHGGGEDWE